MIEEDWEELRSRKIRYFEECKARVNVIARNRGMGGRDDSMLMEHLCLTCELPDVGETAAIAIGKEKTSALFFDRVWTLFPRLVPNGIRFAGTTWAELEAQSVYNFAVCANFGSDREAAAEIFRDCASAHRWNSRLLVEGIERWPFLAFRQGTVASFSSILANELKYINHVSATPVYESCRQRDKALKHRASELAIVSIITNLKLPIEEGLSWEQVIAFRKDRAAHKSVKRLRHWLDTEMVNRSTNQIVDNISLKVDSYNEALKKHGIRTAFSTMAATLSAVSVPIVLEHIHSQPLWLSLVEGILVGGSTMAKVATDYIDKKPEPADDIALVLELNKKLGN